MRVVQKQFGVWLLFLLLVSGCSMISPYNETAYKQATSIKATSLVLMSKAESPYRKYQKEVASLLLEARKAYEYAKQRPKNDISTKQWAIMIDEERHMLAGFFKRWKEQKRLGKFFIEEAQKKIGSGFDTISGLESGKKR